MDTGSEKGKEEEEEEELRVLELFAGIGGMRVALEAALEAAHDPRKVHVTPVDSSQVVRKVYEHNFPEKARPLNLERVKLADLDGKAHIWTMSPPCQPFTTTQMAQQLDLQDRRNAAFLNLMNLLEQMKNRPERIFMENVRGFFGSETHTKWCEVLKRCGYAWRQYLLTPMQFRIPNNRMRFFMVAVQCEQNSSTRVQGAISYTQEPQAIDRLIPECKCDSVKRMTLQGQTLDCSQLQLRQDQTTQALHEECHGGVSGPEGVNPVGAFVNTHLDSDALKELMISEAVLQKKWARGLGYTGVQDRTTFCFTSAYGHTYHRASGSIFHAGCAHRGELSDPEDVCEAYKGKVRRFSAREMLNFFGFPDNFTFPDDMTFNQRCKVVGQSVNVIVVRALMHAHLCTCKKRTRVKAREQANSNANPNMPKSRAGARRAAAQGTRKRKVKEAEVLLVGKKAKKEDSKSAGSEAVKEKKASKATRDPPVDKENLDAGNEEEPTQNVSPQKKESKKAKRSKRKAQPAAEKEALNDESAPLQDNMDVEATEPVSNANDEADHTSVDDAETSELAASSNQEAKSDSQSAIESSELQEQEHEQEPQQQVSEQSNGNNESHGEEMIEQKEDTKVANVAPVDIPQAPPSSPTASAPAPVAAASTSSVSPDTEIRNIAEIYDSDETAKQLELDDIAREQLLQVSQEEKLVFDKIRQEEAINACLQDSSGLALEDMPRAPTVVETLFLELKDLRTTAAEFELNKVRQLAAVRCKAQDAVIQELRGEIKTLRAAKAASVESESLATLKRELAEARTALANFGVVPPAKETAEQTETSESNGPDAEEFLRIKHQLSALKKVTGLSVEIEDDGKLMRCILKNKSERKAVKYEFESAPDGEGIIFRPTGNVRFMPNSMREELDVAGAQDLPALQALIQHELFCAEPGPEMD
ncbi:tRNA cytosine38-C5-methyltransferase [Hondaea fermentalgiana]|uniref:tRNA cytosine38-C5-methyltransferase n=1 Tax=Hondaea fermentalgiana TaxID=2315210 RepID=A0A2R5G807_9STRA|nr:tRNA cytosine38-C5-methyltransferase [Hondaea fermentalgiana]|eukprot:GBG27196.1 tRNA cytosine38-C5-methyltransferase [Hondaea fermentalgiana]